MAAVTAAAVGCAPEEVVVASTGVIGVPLPMDKVRAGIAAAARALSPQGGARGRAGHPHHRHQAEGGRRSSSPSAGGRCALGAMAKGAGMIAPDMATMLAFFTTDAPGGARPPAAGAAGGGGGEPEPHHRGRRHLDQRHGRGPGQRGRGRRPPIEAEGPDFDAFRAAPRRGVPPPRGDDRARRRGGDAHRRGARGGRAHAQPTPTASRARWPSRPW